MIKQLYTVTHSYTVLVLLLLLGMLQCDAIAQDTIDSVNPQQVSTTIAVSQDKILAYAKQVAMGELGAPSAESVHSFLNRTRLEAEFSSDGTTFRSNYQVNDTHVRMRTRAEDAWIVISIGGQTNMVSSITATAPLTATASTGAVTLGISPTYNWPWLRISSKPNFATRWPSWTEVTAKPTLFSGSYNDLRNTPRIPAAQVNSDWSAASGIAQILNKPNLFSGSYSDLTNKPSLFSGSYVDLTNKPAIPAAQVNADWNAATGIARILNKPSLFSGSYTDLRDKPTIPAAQVKSDWDATTGPAEILNKPALGAGDLTGIDAGTGIAVTNGNTQTPTVGISATYNWPWARIASKPNFVTRWPTWTEVTAKPTLFSGSYNDLTNKPTIPTAPVNADWDATSGLAQILNKPAIGTGDLTGIVAGTGIAVTNPSTATPTVGISSTYNWPWSRISGKPTFPATIGDITGLVAGTGIAITNGNTATPTVGISSTYNFPWSRIASKPSFTTRWPTWTEVTAKPSLFSGSYTDLTNKPTIPAAQVNADWNASSGLAQILNKPALPATIGDITGLVAGTSIEITNGNTATPTIGIEALGVTTDEIDNEAINDNKLDLTNVGTDGQILSKDGTQFAWVDDIGHTTHPLFLTRDFPNGVALQNAADTTGVGAQANKAMILITADQHTGSGDNLNSTNTPAGTAIGQMSYPMHVWTSIPNFTDLAGTTVPTNLTQDAQANYLLSSADGRSGSLRYRFPEGSLFRVFRAANSEENPSSNTNRPRMQLVRWLPQSIVTQIVGGSSITVTDGGRGNSTPTVAVTTGGITTTLLADGSVTTAKIGDGAVTNAKLANNAVTSAKIDDGAVGPSDLSQNAVTSTRIADGTITSADIGNNAVTTNKIANDAVTEAKLDMHNSPSSGDVLTYDSSNGLQWQSNITGISGVNATAPLTATGTNTRTIALPDNSLTPAKLQSITLAQQAAFRQRIGAQSGGEQTWTISRVTQANISSYSRLITIPTDARNGTSNGLHPLDISITAGIEAEAPQFRTVAVTIELVTALSGGTVLATTTTGVVPADSVSNFTLTHRWETPPTNLYLRIRDLPQHGGTFEVNISGSFTLRRGIIDGDNIDITPVTNTLLDGTTAQAAFGEFVKLPWTATKQTGSSTLASVTAINVVAFKIGKAVFIRGTFTVDQVSNWADIAVRFNMPHGSTAPNQSFLGTWNPSNPASANDTLVEISIDNNQIFFRISKPSSNSHPRTVRFNANYFID